MKLSCPECGATFGLLAAINDANARRFVAMMGEVHPTMAPVIIEYLTLFRPQHRGLSWKSATNRLRQVMDLINSGVVKVGRDQYGTTPEMWSAGMRKMMENADRIERPLENHNYLKKVVRDFAKEKNRKDAREEREVELSRQQRQSLPRKDDEITDPKTAMQHMTGLKNLIDTAEEKSNDTES